MYMLHNRRKAEIEILSTAKPSQRRRLQAAEVLLSTSESTSVRSRWISKDSPLLDYLLDKISDFVDACADN